MFSGPDGPGIDDITDEDAAVTDLPGRSGLEDHFDGRIDETVAADDGQRHALDHVGGILDATIDAFLAALADAMHIVVLKPVDVCFEQGLLDLLELRLSDDGFYLFHTLLLLRRIVSIRV